MESNLFDLLKRAVKDPVLCNSLLERLTSLTKNRNIRFMEVCGSHTTALFQSGLRSLLPQNLIHLSGPGCPVCVTHDSEVAFFLDLAKRKNFIIATFGDLLRVPGNNGSSLKHAQANGAKIEIIYSPLNAIELAKKNIDYEIVFLGAGFETTAPGVAGLITTAKKLELKNLSVFSMHKLIAPALRLLVKEKDNQIDAFLLPGHVATITGLTPFNFLADEYGIPSVVAGFEPGDLLLALCKIADMISRDLSKIENAYQRAVSSQGNIKAMELLDQVFEKHDALWRGLGRIEDSGLKIRSEFAQYDVMQKFDLSLPEVEALPGCQCGEVLRGRLQPPKCPLFAKKCSPQNPMGPCMVSTEGSCAAFYKYGYC